MASVTDHGAADDPRSGATSLADWATAVAAALDDDDTTVDTRIATSSAADQSYADGLAAAIEGGFGAVRASLDVGQSCAIQVLGTSTADGVSDWPYLFAQAVAAEHPEWTVHHALWSDAAQDYGATTVLQTGTGGGRYLDCATGTTTRRIPASVSPYLSGVIDVRMRLSLADWTPASAIIICGKSGANGQRGWYAAFQGSTGRLQFTFSTDGEAGTLTTMTSNAAPTVADGATTWVRWLFQPNDGSGNRVFKSYQSADGVTWAQLGTTITTAGAVTVFDNSATGYEVGGAASGIGHPGAKIYEVQFRNGDGGPIVAPALPEFWPPYSTAAAYCVGAPVLTFVNGASSGATMTYLGDATRLKKLMPDYGQAVTIMAASHNEGLTMGRAYVTALAAWRTTVEAQLGNIPVVLCPENPQTPAAAGNREHAARRIGLLAYARRAALQTLDVFPAFTAVPDWETALMADSVHPNAAGSALWRDEVKAAFDASE